MWKSRRATVLNSGVLALGLLLIGASSTAAQSTAIVCGTVTDQYGGVVPGVAVSLGQKTPAAKAAFTAKDGGFMFSGVEPGTYSVTFALDGFKKAVRNGIAIVGGQEFLVDQRLEPAGPVSHPDSASASIAYDPSKTSPGSTFTKTITPAGTATLRPCNAEK